MSATPRKLKRVVIKEELVALTGDHISAVLLSQLLYWSERVKGKDKLLLEEQSRIESNFGTESERPYTHGWIYKTAKDLIDETMLGISEQKIRRTLQRLVDAGYLSQRHNPVHRWDRTIQYRPNLKAIAADLQALGYPLHEYPDCKRWRMESPIWRYHSPMQRIEL